MPERSSKTKARRDSPVNSLDEPESSSMRTENAASLSDRDFTEFSEKIEKSVSKRIKDAEVGQREILKMIENLTSKIDTLTERPPNNVRHDPDDEDAENTDYRYRLVEPSDLLPNHGQHSSQKIITTTLYQHIYQPRRLPHLKFNPSKRIQYAKRASQSPTTTSQNFK